MLGEVNGNVTASRSRHPGRWLGGWRHHLPRVAIAEGAHFRGSVDMQRKGAQPGRQKSASSSQPEKEKAQAAASASLSLKRRRTSTLRV